MVSGGSSVLVGRPAPRRPSPCSVSPAANSVFGSIVKMVGPPLTTVSATLRVPLVAQTIWNQLPVTFTGSLKVTVRFAFVATSVAPLVGGVVA